MAKQLNLDELQEAAARLNLPGAASWARLMEALADVMAQAIAQKLGVECGVASCEGPAFAGTCVPFYAKSEDQECPAVLADYDPTEWGTRDTDDPEPERSAQQRDRGISRFEGE